MHKQVTGVLIDIESGFFGEATLDGTLEGYYKALKCDCIDITPRIIGGTVFAVYCDDAGLLKEDPVPSAYTSDGKPQLVGNLFIAKVNEDGDTESLTSSEIRLINQHVRIGMMALGNRLSIQPFLIVE